MPNEVIPEQTADDIFREQLEAARIEAMVSAGKRQEYIKAKVMQFGPKFWDKMAILADSPDPLDVKLFIQEYNKVQGKIIPAEIGGLNGEAINLTITKYREQDGDDQSDTTISIQPETLPVGISKESEEV